MVQQNPAASGKLNSNNGSARHDSVDMAEAMALMTDAGNAGDKDTEETASADDDAGEDAPAEDDGSGGETAEEAADEEIARRLGYALSLRRPLLSGPVPCPSQLQTVRL